MGLDLFARVSLHRYKIIVRRNFGIVKTLGENVNVIFPVAISWNLHSPKSEHSHFSHSLSEAIRTVRLIINNDSAIHEILISIILINDTSFEGESYYYQQKEATISCRCHSVSSIHNTY